MAVLNNPNVPLIIDAGVDDGFIISYRGTCFPQCQGFEIRFQTGRESHNDILLFVNARFAEGAVLRNARIQNQWGPEDRQGPFPFAPGAPFDIMVLAEGDSYKIAINGEHFAEFAHRADFRAVTTVVFEGDVSLQEVQYEGGVPPNLTGQMKEMNVSGGGGGGYGYDNQAPPPYSAGGTAGGGGGIGFESLGGGGGGGPGYGAPGQDILNAGGGAQGGYGGTEEEGWFSRKKDKKDYSVDTADGTWAEGGKAPKQPGFIKRAAPGFVGGLVGGVIAGAVTSRLAYPGRKKHHSSGGIFGHKKHKKDKKHKKHKKHHKHHGYGGYRERYGSGSSSSGSSGSSGSSCSDSGSCSD